jgi:hypothetical protein
MSYVRAGIMISVLVGCFQASGDSPEGITYGRLQFIAMAICKLTHTECQRLDSYERTLDLVVRKGYLSVRKDYEVDERFNPYGFLKKDANEEIVIRVISAGRNGKLEDGKGDDLFCEVTIRKSGKNDFRMHPKDLLNP